MCVSASAGRCQGQLEREFYQFNLKVREGVCVCMCLSVCLCEGGPREMKEETFFPFMKINFYNLKA